MSDDQDTTPQPIPESPASEEKPAGPFDSLMVSPEEAKRLEDLRASTEILPEPEPEPEDEGNILPEQVERICMAIDRLARKGLNLRAVIALLHDAHPSIPKKHIKAILEGLRELPMIYGAPSHQRAER